MGLKAALLLIAALTGPAGADTLRVATYGADLSRKGPGLLLRDIRAGEDQVMAAVEVIAATAPDVILLTDFDWDHGGQALDVFAARLRKAGLDLPHHFAAQPNRGIATGLDLDGDGRLGTGDDAQGFGLFTGQGGMALLSRLPLGEVTDYSGFLWRDLPGNLMPDTTPPEAAAVQRLSSTAHWDVPVMTRGGPLHLLTWSATPPVFDGPEDRNGRRNHDEAVFWLKHRPDAPFLLIGNSNLDPVDGEGLQQAMTRIFAIVQDPAPRGEWQPPQTGANVKQTGDPALDTADWPDADGPGNLRVDYVLPAPDLEIAASGVVWPHPDSAIGQAVDKAGPRRLVWVDITLP